MESWRNSGRVEVVLSVIRNGRLFVIDLVGASVDIDFETADVTTIADPQRREVRTGRVDIEVRGFAPAAERQVDVGPRFDYQASADFLQENGFPEHVVEMLRAIGRTVEPESPVPGGDAVARLPSLDWR